MPPPHPEIGLRLLKDY